MSTHFMIDIESASTKRNAAISQIGVVAMRVDEKRVASVYDGRDYRIDINDYDNYLGKFHTSINTMLWWASQDPWTLQAAFGKPDRQKQEARVPLRTALYEMTLFMKDANHSNKKRVWAKPPQFDLVILENAYEVIGLPVPWNYREERDLRTLLSMVPKDISIHGLPMGEDQAKHNAFDDANHQMKQLIGCFKALGRIK